MDNYGVNVIKICVIINSIVVVSLAVTQYLKFRRARNSEKSRSALIKFIFSLLFISAVSMMVLVPFGRVFLL